MVKSNAQTVSRYLEELPAEKRKAVAAVRKCIRAHLPRGYRETMNWGMIAYEIPSSRYPNTYNGQPLLYCALAAQKNHYAVYMVSVYAGSPYLAMLRKGYRDAGIKLTMGKCCVRFRNLDEIDLPTVGEVVAACPPGEFIRIYEKSRKRRR